MKLNIEIEPVSAEDWLDCSRAGCEESAVMQVWFIGGGGLWCCADCARELAEGIQAYLEITKGGDGR